MRRKWVVVGVGAVLAVLLAGGLLLPQPRWQSPEARLARIKVGMSRADVEAVIGRPADDDTSSPAVWWEGGWIIAVAFDKDGRVRLKDGMENPAERMAPKPTWHDRLRDWLRL